MDSEVHHVGKASLSGGLAEERLQPLPPANSKLPNKVLSTTCTVSCGKEVQPADAFLQEATSDLDQAMKKLVAEVRN